MAEDIRAINERLRILERQVRTLKIMTAGAIVLAGVLATVPQDAGAQQAAGPLRVRQLVVEDGEGRSRMLLGYLDAPGNTRRFGIRINDPGGAERFGLSYREDGGMGMGFDAPPGTGDDRNRERINIGADAKGGSYIRFLDRRTFEAARMYLDDQNRTWMQFSEFSQQAPPRIRRYGLSGEEIVSPK